MTCWNALDHTKLTLRSMFDTVHHPFFLTIVDNGSRDGTQEFLKNLEISSWCEKVVMITNEINRGIIDANNQGQVVSKQYSLKYTCICNNDLYFQDNWLSILENHMENDLDLGIIGTLRPAIDVAHHIRHESSKVVVDGTPKGYSITEELEYFQGPHTFTEAAKMLIAKNKGGIAILRCPPNAVVTCCALVRNSVSDKIGLFSDTLFEMYGSEDIDFSWRLQKAGYHCGVAKDVYVHHFRHRSISASNLDREKYLRENNIKLFNKWKCDIFTFLKNEEKKGVDIRKNLSSEENHEYFFLRRIREKIDFMIEYQNE
ncbi:MAG: glycosyltransferase [Candidatus Paceibacterota bacterium]